MKKMIALLAILALLLCGCGSNETPAASTSATPDSESTLSTAEATDSSVAEPDAADGTELARQIWAMAEEAEENLYATDYDLSMKIEIELDGNYSSAQSSIRTKTIDSDTDPMTYVKSATDDQVTEVWYGNGTLYHSGSTGRYCVPMSYEDYLAQEGTSDEDQALLELNPDNFANLFATTSESFHTVTFSQPTLETWIAFSGLLGLDENTVTCTHFDLAGSMQCDLEGNVNQVKLDMELTLDISGVTTNMTVSVNQLTMGTNEAVTIELPSSEDFTQLEDLSIPTALATAQMVTSTQPSLQYQNVWGLVLSSDTIYDVVTQNDLITYVTDETGLQAQWDDSITVNDETIYAYSDVYAGGSGVITDTDGESEYSYDDESMLLDINNFIFHTSEALSYGTNFSTQDGTLTFELREDYAEAILLEALSGYEVDYFVTEGSLERIYGSMLYLLDDSGLMVSQLMTLSAEVTYEGELVTITLMDGGDVLAIGSDVVMP